MEDSLLVLTPTETTSPTNRHTVQESSTPSAMPQVHTSKLKQEATLTQFVGEQSQLARLNIAPVAQAKQTATLSQIDRQSCVNARKQESSAPQTCYLVIKRRNQRDVMARHVGRYAQ